MLHFPCLFPFTEATTPRNIIPNTQLDSLQRNSCGFSMSSAAKLLSAWYFYMISPESGEVYPHMTLLFLQSDREWSSQVGIKTAIFLVILLLK